MITTASQNVAAQMSEMARRQPRTLAIAYPQRRNHNGRVNYARWNYSQLNQESDRLAWGLESAGIRRGTRTVLMVKPGLEFFALAFALFKIGAVPVLIDPGRGVRSLGQCLAEAEPEAFIGIPKAQLARVLYRWAKPTLKIIVTVGKRWLWGGLTLDQVRQAGCVDTPFVIPDVASEETAAILFTSGSTGAPKGVVYTHGIFSAQVDLLRDLYGIEPGEIDLSTFPLFGLFAPALGMTAIIPDMDYTRPAQVDAGKLLEAIENFGVTTMFGSPALLDRVAQYSAERGFHLPTLRRVISAGAPVRADILKRFTPLLPPGAEVFTPYGATEALPVCSIGSDEILKETAAKTAQGQGICVGRPVKSMKVGVICITDEPISAWSEDLLVPCGAVGEIVVQGPVVTKEYFNRPESTVLAKIPGPHGKELYHRMGDLGRLNEHGRLWFYGRKSQRVVTSEETLFTIPCEAIFNTHPLVRRTALIGVGEKGRSVPVLCVELRQNHSRAEQIKIKAELLDLGASAAHTRSIKNVLFHPAFPVDIRHNAKIFREKLALWAARQLP